MLKLTAKISGVLILGSMLSMPAVADISTSLQSVCSEAKQLVQTGDTQSAADSRKEYQAKLSNFYRGVTCEGKALLLQSSQDNGDNTVTTLQSHNG